MNDIFVDKPIDEEQNKYNELLNQISFTGTQIHCFFTCHRQLWFFSNYIQREDENDFVQIGRLLHENSYKHEKKEIEIDNKIKIDFFKKDAVISEIKKSPSSEEAHIWQLKYYLYYLKTKKMVVNVSGKIHYPKLKQVIEVNLTNDDIIVLENALKEINKILKLDKPPIIEKKTICKKCSYYDFCFC
ncbi:MAG TPA: CRISPR-associated protein Cas4 [bacterium]|nr:CRISPR-associated protein Cas4 [bacterium]HOL48901.1 CRISPR-associated protein Cas4 [bacterium]HPQ20144.1 CRISPR-associated protein Cas4 [bacterium]